MALRPCGPAAILKAFLYTGRGFRFAFQTEASFRSEVYLAIPMIVAGFLLGRTALERIALVGSVLLVLLVELLNTAVETIIDRFNPEPHLLSGRAKDLGSAAVFMSLLLVALCWGEILAGRFLA